MPVQGAVGLQACNLTKKYKFEFFQMQARRGLKGVLVEKVGGCVFWLAAK